MRMRLGMKSLAITAFMLLSLSAEGAEAPSIISWSNSKTKDQKTVFQVKPGEKVTFTVKADGAEQHQWLVDKVIQKDTKGSSFTWTAPNKKGMWKILLKTTNNARLRWMDKQVPLWNKLIVEGKGGPTKKGIKDRGYAGEKEQFIQGMIEHRLYPLKTRKEWIVSTFLTRVKPGQSIQKAIDSLPPEGGIVWLAPGIHQVNEKMYPTRVFPAVVTRRTGPRPPFRYSIIIKRSNVAICGERASVVRHHSIPDAIPGWNPPAKGRDRHYTKGANWFLIPDMEATDPNLYFENITFRGFTTESTYGPRDRAVASAVVHAEHVRNLTVEDIHDKSYAFLLARVGSHERHRRYSENIFYFNNDMEYTHTLATFARNVYVMNNTYGTNQVPWVLHIDGDVSRVYLSGNKIIRSGNAYGAIAVDGSYYVDIYNNLITCCRCGINIHQYTNTLIVERNRITGTRQNAILPHNRSCRNVVIVNNLIYDNKGAGIYYSELGGLVKRCTMAIMNNVICNNGGDGISLATDYMEQSTITNNIITGNKGCGINHIPGRTTLSHNCLWNNARGDYKGCAAGKGDFSKDPLFADPTNGDFHLRSKAGRWDPKARNWVKDAAHSPCIDAGNPKADHSREPAPNGGRANIGAYGNTKEASKSTRS